MGAISENLIEKQVCYHCGDACSTKDIVSGDKVFCCAGCKLVYEILETSDLCTYYSIENTPGISPKESGIGAKFKYLEDENVRQQLLSFTDGRISKVTLNIPDMHCSSCIWLLENLFKLNEGVVSSKVNFLRKELTITFEENKTGLKDIVSLLASIGYEPLISLDSLQQKINKETDKDLYIKIGVAGFCFANIMVLSFPEYLAYGSDVQAELKNFFRYLNILLSLPVFFYSSIDYFKSALNGWKQKMVNMDVPISLGILTLFLRSLYEIISGAGSGFMDSFAGLVFLLLIGKLFQKKTYDSLSFDRDYRSYFPVSVMRREKDGEKSVPIANLKKGDRIILRNQELIPADSVLINGSAYIDYSFVTGESVPVEKSSGDIIYAGGRQVGSTIQLDVIKDVSHSYLTQLWNDEAFTKFNQGKITSLANSISKYFTLIVISIAILSALYWLPKNVGFALNAFTAVLIIACPCALALSTPFTLGNTLRIFGKNKFYLKNISVIETMAKITDIVFDKTGTLTLPHLTRLNFVSAPGLEIELSQHEIQQVFSLVRQSTHPLSQRIFTSLDAQKIYTVENYNEFPGKGIEGFIDDVPVRIGSRNYVDSNKAEPADKSFTSVHVSIDNIYRGYFKITNEYRPGLKRTIKKLLKNFKISLLTGDNAGEKENLLTYFPEENELYFDQTPFDKLQFIKSLQLKSKKVLMIGDGLNDAGALKQSDLGISIAEDVNTFSPASDAILEAGKFTRLYDFIKFSKISMKIIVISFGISFLYNFAGLSFAVQGTLSPLVSAILMPISSISVILFTTGTTAFFAKKRGLL